MAKIGYLLHAAQSSEWYRAFVPGQVLASLGHEVTYLHEEDSASDFLEQDIVALIRAGKDTHVVLIDVLHGSGKRAVVDLDDNPWALPKSDPRVEEWERLGGRSALEACLSSADAVTCPSKDLAVFLGRFNRNVALLENCLPDPLWLDLRKPERTGDKLVIGWAGGITHTDDLRLIASPLLQIVERYPNVELNLAGQFGGLLKSPFLDHPRIKQLDIVSVGRYQELLTGFDIGLAPLVDNQFNRGKSDLKFLEYSALGIPCVASAVSCYEGSIVHGKTGYLAKNDKDWIAFLKRLIESDDVREEIGRAAKEWSETRMISANIYRWEDAYGIGISEPKIENEG